MTLGWILFCSSLLTFSSLWQDWFRSRHVVRDLRRKTDGGKAGKHTFPLCLEGILREGRTPFFPCARYHDWLSLSGARIAGRRGTWKCVHLLHIAEEKDGEHHLPHCQLWSWLTSWLLARRCHSTGKEWRPRGLEMKWPPEATLKVITVIWLLIPILVAPVGVDSISVNSLAWIWEKLDWLGKLFMSEIVLDGS